MGVFRVFLYECLLETNVSISYCRSAISLLQCSTSHACTVRFPFFLWVLHWKIILKLRCLCCFFSIMGTNLTFSAMSEGSWMKSRSCFFSFFLYTSQNPGRLLRTSDVITLQMQISFNHPAIVSFLFISQSFSLRKPTGAHSALLAVITGDRKRRGEFKGCCI